MPSFIICPSYSHIKTLSSTTPNAPQSIPGLFWNQPVNRACLWQPAGRPPPSWPSLGCRPKSDHQRRRQICQTARQRARRTGPIRCAAGRSADSCDGDAEDILPEEQCLPTKSVGPVGDTIRSETSIGTYTDPCNHETELFERVCLPRAGLLQRTGRVSGSTDAATDIQCTDTTTPDHSASQRYRPATATDPVVKPSGSSPQLASPATTRAGRDVPHTNVREWWLWSPEAARRI